MVAETGCLTLPLGLPALQACCVAQQVNRRARRQLDVPALFDVVERPLVGKTERHILRWLMVGQRRVESRRLIPVVIEGRLIVIPRLCLGTALAVVEIGVVLVVFTGKTRARILAVGADEADNPVGFRTEVVVPVVQGVTIVVEVNPRINVDVGHTKAHFRIVGSIHKQD